MSYSPDIALIPERLTAFKAGATCVVMVLTLGIVGVLLGSNNIAEPVDPHEIANYKYDTTRFSIEGAIIPRHGEIEIIREHGTERAWIVRKVYGGVAISPMQ